MLGSTSPMSRAVVYQPQVGLDSAKYFHNLERTLPAFFSRKEICKMLGGVFVPKTLSNLDSRGDGPPKFAYGRKVVYEKDSFLAWLKPHIRQCL